MMNDFFGERLLALRELEGITQTSMAERLRVTPSFLTGVTKGTKRFPNDLVVRASEAYQVPLEFFTVAAQPEDAGLLTFRKKSTALVKEDRRVGRLYTEAARLFRTASESSGYRTADLPDPAEHGDSPERVAETIRRTAGIDDLTPITNMTRFCERLGVGVVDQLDPTPPDDPRHSGASRPWRSSGRPLIAIASTMTPAAKRFTIGHELYHLIADTDLQQPITSSRDPRELRANRFAGALLMTRAAASAELAPTMTLHHYLRVKARFGVEVSGLIHRAEDLGIIDHNRARSLYIQWSSSGWRTTEPVEVADERPLLLAQALRRVYGTSFAMRAAADHGVPARLISHWTARSSARSADAPAGAQVFTLADRRRRT